ncbi:MAG: hypothetical protein KDC73_07405 [Ignavibacteriae bacterium]|nr:hypothetical protein [Ignavibacteriota bacterium]MCB0724517.1 hypothetical protein [Ignavibacteriota bacterium]MCB9244544.1 hypothetical protein [Ignavibacteriales bacterium]
MENFKDIFTRLKKNLTQFKKGIVVQNSTEDNYYLNTNTEFNKKPMFFAAVAIKKNYVSYYLMPVYTNPALLKGISPALKKKMQGKSCFNFKTIDEDLFKELGDLTKKGYESFKKEGFIK